MRFTNFNKCENAIREQTMEMSIAKLSELVLLLSARSAKLAVIP